MDGITPSEARDALAATESARQLVAAEIGLPRGYWWFLAAGWLGLGALGQFGPGWLTTVATIAFGAAHSSFASRFLDGRNRTSGLQVSRSVAGRRTPIVVIAMLLVLVGVTVGVALGLDADGASHPTLWSGVFVAVIVGLGGPEILKVLLRWARA
ncbi:MAG: hypothetical protein ACTHJM_12205 [Marmoricola sp.]